MRLGILLGALVGFVIQLIFTEWLYVDTFGNHDALEGVIVVAAAVAGALLGKWVARRLVNRRRARPA